AVVHGFMPGTCSSSTFARSDLHRDERPADDLPCEGVRDSAVRFQVGLYVLPYNGTRNGRRERAAGGLGLRFAGGISERARAPYLYPVTCIRPRLKRPGGLG